MHPSYRIKFLLFAVVVVGAAWVLGASGFDFEHLTPERVGAYVRSFGIWAPAVYLGVFAQPVLPLPASLMAIVGGVAFGKSWGVLAALAGCTLRACTQFMVARLLGREAIAKLLKGKVAELDHQIGQNAFKTVMLIRLIPNVPFDIQNYALGFSEVGAKPYVLATMLGLVPGCFAFVYLGYSLTEPSHVWKLGLAVLLIIAVMFGPSFFRKRPAKQPEAETG
jgi:uncharacterized membrane protein YdjX (TVP38/TMEM64 family)